MNFDNPPKDASYEKLLEVCEVLREGELAREELYEAVDQGKTLVRDNIRYGQGLGFLEESEEGVSVTSRGIEASYNQGNPQELTEQFQAGLHDYQLYKVVLKELVEKGVAQKEEITKRDVLQVFRTSVGLEGSEKTLGSAATTFLNALEAAGLGDYVIGRRGKETRLELNEDFDLVERIINVDKEEEEPSQRVGQERIDSPNQSIAKNVPRPDPDTSSSLQIRLELSGDEDPTEIEELIVGVRRGLIRDLDISDSGKNSLDTGSFQINSIGDSEDSGQENKEKSDNETEEGSSDQSLDTFMEPESEPNGE